MSEYKIKNKKSKDKTALVTGGAGFIGSNLVDELVKQGWMVKVIDNLSTGQKSNLNPKAEFYRADVTNFRKIKPLFEGVDYVFHLAAVPRIEFSINNPILSNKVNLNGTLNVLVAARDAKVKKVIYSASSSAYGFQDELPWREDMPAKPITPYGLQKYVGEVYVKQFSQIYGLPTVSLRYFNVYGRRQSTKGAYTPVIITFAKQKLAGQPLTICGDGRQRRDCTNVDDVVTANIMAAESNKVGKGEVINIGRGVNFSVNELAQIIGGPTIEIAPRFEVRESLADTSLAKKLLGWKPKVNLPDWLEDFKKEIGL